MFSKREREFPAGGIEFPAVLGDSLNAKLIGSLYAGGVEKVGMDRYLERAHKLWGRSRLGST